MHANGQAGGAFQRARSGANVLVFAASVLAFPLELCLRRGFGSRYFGLHALGAVVLLPLWMVLWPGHDPTVLNVFCVFLFLMLVRARKESLRLSASGVPVHTRYNGWPKLSLLFRRTDERKIKGVAEPAFGLLAGLLLMGVDEPLGSLLVASAFGLFFMQVTIESVERARALELNDAMIEQEQLSERFRAMRGDRM